MNSPPADGGSRRPLVVAGIGLGAFALLALLATRACGDGPKKTVAPTLDRTAYDDSASPVPVTADDPMRGHRDALVTLVVFSSLQCPYTARAEPELVAFEKALGPDKIRTVWKTYLPPTHDKARAAGLAGIAVFTLGGSDAFFAFRDTALRNQPYFGPQGYGAWATEAGVDGFKVRVAESEPAYAEKLLADAAVARRLGVTRTPTYFANGTELEGPVPQDKLEALVKSELAKAEALVAAGTPRAKVYVESSKKNAARPEH